MSREDWRTGSIPEFPLLRKQKFKTQKGASMAEKKTYEPFDELLKASGLRIEVIAQRSGIKYSRLYQWRVNPKRMTAIGASYLAQTLGCDVDDFVDITKKFEKELCK